MEKQWKEAKMEEEEEAEEEVARETRKGKKHCRDNAQVSMAGRPR